MKKLLILFLMMSCLPAFAQKEVKALDNVVRINTELSRSISQQISKTEQAATILANTGQVLVSLQIPDVSPTLQIKFVQPIESVERGKVATGKLLRSTYMRYQEADMDLNNYLVQASQADNASFLYRGMHINDFRELELILLQGLPVNHTGYNSIYMSASFAVARHYAKLEEGIPVIVTIKKEDVAGSLRPGNLPNFYAEKDIPAQAIYDVFVLLDINNEVSWYRVVLQDGLIFMPLIDKAVSLPAKSNAQYVQLANFSGQVSVKFRLKTPVGVTAQNSARLLPYDEVISQLIPAQQMFVPHALLGNGKSLFRGMALNNFNDVKNLLTDGLEISKSNFPGQVFTTLTPRMALAYAIPDAEYARSDVPVSQFPVLVQIPLTSSLEKYAPEILNAPQGVFERDVPAGFISDVWVFLEVNGKPDWYKVTLEDGELVLYPTDSRLFQSNELIQHELDIPQRNIHYRDF